MIDNFALAISHGLMMLAIWALLKRPDLDREPSPHDREPRRRARSATNEGPAREDRPGA